MEKIRQREDVKRNPAFRSRFAKKKITKGMVVEIQRDIIVDEPISKDELEPSESKMLKQ